MSGEALCLEPSLCGGSKGPGLDIATVSSASATEAWTMSIDGVGRGQGATNPGEVLGSVCVCTCVPLCDCVRVHVSVCSV